MSALPKQMWTPASYLAFERGSDQRHEYLYVLISQSGYRIEKYLRQSASEWLLSDTIQLEAACELSSIGCTLALADVYEKVTLEDELV